MSGWVRRVRTNHAITRLLLLVLCVRSGAAARAVPAGGLGARLLCARGLTERQRALCHAAPAHVAQLGIGLSMAYAECRSQLSGRRWNCSGVGDHNYFGHVMPKATREAAFTYAITAAGATHALSAACARGDLPGCGCSSNRLSPSRRRGAASLTAVTTSPGAEQFQWGGCGEVALGARFARKFLDARELEADARSLMNLHNNRVGRKLVKDLIRQECKCHGVSGSCTVQTCWRALPPFRAVAAALKEKYRKAKLVVPRTDGLALGLGKTQFFIKRRHPEKSERQPRRSELVYLEPSPSYCEPDAASGAPGTHGRHCNRTSRGEDGCESLCCGRGYSTARAVARQQCRCRFHWCCRVSCDTCLVRTDTHICK
ncbi:protein Wnt-7b [Amyelois transitella]|uniref:protein Wnt-7b n=1 Tax=Amyelois transitella TaxID=680683 RepID=UPI0029902F37|nr:protein Wnt-7b [Amyelois transitella]